MKIELVDPLSSSTASGMGRYAMELFRHLANLTDVVFRESLYFPWADHLPLLRTLPLGIRNHTKGSLVHLTHSIGCTQMLWNPIHPSVVTVHDLGFVSWPPERAMFKHAWMDTFLVKLAHEGLKRADAIIADSEFTRQELVSKLHVSIDRVDVIHLGVDHQRFKRLTNARLLLSQRYAFLDDPKAQFLLNVGSEFQRKNLGTLFSAMSLLPSQVKLVKIGSSGGERFRADSIHQIRQYGLEQRVILIDYVPEKELPLFYNAADVYVCPSFLEGFGLPILEAMACGTPVVCSSASSLPEIAGDAAILVQPQDANAFAQAIGSILDDAGVRSNLRDCGLNRARQFTWDKTVQNTIRTYEKCSR